MPLRGLKSWYGHAFYSGEAAWKTVPAAHRSWLSAGLPSALRCARLLTTGDLDGLDLLCRRLSARRPDPVGLYYHALLHHLRGRDPEALDDLDRLLACAPAHPEGVQLRARIGARSGDRAGSVRALLALAADRPACVKTWRSLAQHLREPAEYQAAAALRARHVAAGRLPACLPKLDTELAVAAMNAGLPDQARSVLHTIIAHHAAAGPARPRRFKYLPFSARAAETALADLARAFRAHHVDMFLVSGTFLGCIRENRLLAHDKDLDVGIWDDTPRETVRAALADSARFFEHPSRNPSTLRLRHLNGTAIDVFYHYREPQDYWHGGLKIKWHNRPFRLVPRRFLGEDHLVPEDHDTYLTENYGDWRTPRIDFDSALDTPNGEICDRREFAFALLRTVAGLVAAGKTEKLPRYVRVLQDLGEPIPSPLSA